MARKKAAAAESAKPADAPAEDWDDPVEDQDSGETADDDDTEADLAARSNVDHDNPEGASLAPALTDRQQVGLDPVDPAKHAEQAGDRENLTNAQTDHEAANALDAISGTPNPGVVDPVHHSAPGALGASDMSGNMPMADVLEGTSGAAKEALTKLQKASKDAKSKGDQGKGHGWMTLKEAGVSKAVMDSLVNEGKVDQETRPGGRFSPETGTVYRLKGHGK